MKKIAQCELSNPATCNHRIDGDLSHIVLCGGNGLSEDIMKCPYRYIEIVEDVAETKDPICLYELSIDGEIIGVFSDEDKASKYANSIGEETHQVFPLGTFLKTDME